MSTVYYPSLDDADVIHVEFLTLQGGVRLLRLLVDSGFTGRSSVILGNDASELVHAQIPATQATGALRGEQNRAWVTCRIPELRFQSTLIAIITDVTPLSLPPDLQGMAGLTFLRQFARWGAERTVDGWQFSISNSARRKGRSKP
jgi:hypothetical protein